jgi:hypothetical protein
LRSLRLSKIDLRSHQQPKRRKLGITRQSPRRLPNETILSLSNPLKIENIARRTGAGIRELSRNSSGDNKKELFHEALMQFRSACQRKIGGMSAPRRKRASISIATSGSSRHFGGRQARLYLHRWHGLGIPHRSVAARSLRGHPTGI